VDVLINTHGLTPNPSPKKKSLTPNPSPKGEGSDMPCNSIAFFAYQLSNYIAYYAPLPLERGWG
ncbi:MAG: hypothetical protein ACFNVO_10330, partial [Prevotella sp.]